MGERIYIWIADLTKWSLIVLVAAIALYVVWPKYRFDRIETVAGEDGIGVGVVRTNRITGKVDFTVTTSASNSVPSQQRISDLKHTQFEGMTIREFRAEFPCYSDVPDIEIARRIHAKYVADVSFPEFARQFLGYVPQE